MIKGTTESGFGFEFDPENVNDMEWLELAAEAEGDPTKYPKVIEMALGREQKKRLYDHIRTDSGRVPIDKAMEVFREIMDIAGEKNS